MEEHPLVVIGAGICGLLCAHQLREAGHSVVVLEKSKGFGGRMATKRLGDAVCDQGAQFFVARDFRFGSLISTWEDQGLVRPWPGSGEGGGETRWIGIPSMTSVAKHLAKDLDVRREVRVRALASDAQGWKVWLQGGGAIRTRRVIATAPVPQVLEWLGEGESLPGEDDLEILRRVSYDPCLTLTLRLSAAPSIPAPGWLSFPQGSHPIFHFVADNRMKGVSPVEAVTLQANSAWSAVHYSASDEDVTRLLLNAAVDWVGGRVAEAALHRWRYSRVARAIPLSHWSNSKRTLLMAGDAFGGARVEGAVTSAFDAVRCLQDALEG